MVRSNLLAALLASSFFLLPLAGCRSHPTIVEPQAQPRPDHRDDDHHPPPPPDHRDDHHGDHR